MLVKTNLKGPGEGGKSVTVRTFECDMPFGDNLADTVRLYGEETVFKWAQAAARVDIQAVIRPKMAASKDKDGKDLPAASDDELAKLAREWKPGAGTRVRKSKAEKVREQFSALTPEEKRALLAQLTGGKSKAAAQPSA